MTEDLVVGRWGARFRGRRFPCAVGRGGIGVKGREGDGVTPAGAHRIEALLRRPDRTHDPCTAHARSRCRAFRSGLVGPRDGWSDDPADPEYNCPVRRPHRFGHEALRRADPLYDLLAVLDWNRAPAVPGRGSAIFLHVWKAPRHPTAGCIGFRRADLAWILARWTPRSRVVVRGWGKGKLRHRLATRHDLPALVPLMEAAIERLQAPFLDPAQIASSRAIMRLDTQLVDDGTYFVVEQDGRLAGCGGWSRRATLYGGDRSPGRDAALLEPARDPARVRAMYTHPEFVRRGVGRLILSLCEDAARAEGFARVELMATLAGERLYRACGYEPVEEVVDDRGGAPVPLVRMRKAL